MSLALQLTVIAVLTTLAAGALLAAQHTPTYMAVPHCPQCAGEHPPLPFYPRATEPPSLQARCPQTGGAIVALPIREEPSL